MTKVRDVLSKQDQAQFYDLDFECTNSRTLILNLFALNIESARGSGLLIILQDMTEKKTIDKHLQDTGQTSINRHHGRWESHTKSGIP